MSANNSLEVMQAGYALMTEFGITIADISLEPVYISAPINNLQSSFTDLSPSSFSGGKFWTKQNVSRFDSIQDTSFVAKLAPANYEITLPDSVYPKRTEEELKQLQEDHWDRVKELDRNDPDRILYDRRFSCGMTSNPFNYYQPDKDAVRDLPPVNPYQTKLDVPEDAKILIVTGYHHLEKPYGHLFEKMFKEQVEYNPDQILFLNIQNTAVLTGDNSPRSEQEIKNAVKEYGITHVIDVHEQLAMANNYIPKGVPGSKTQFGDYEGQKHGDVWEYTLDAFVPTNHIELAQEGVIAPPFQNAINKDIQSVEELIKDIKRTQDIDAGIIDPKAGKKDWLQEVKGKGNLDTYRGNALSVGIF